MIDLKTMMPATGRYLATLLAVAILAGCGKREKPGYVSFDGLGLGTSFHITVGGGDTAGLRSAIDSVFRLADNSMSVYNPNSLLSRLNRNETDSLDRHISYCIETAARVSDMGGEYDITVKPLSQAWGFTGEAPTYRPNVDSLLQYVGYKKIGIAGGKLVKDDPAIQLDLNSIAKGYVVDLMGEMIASRGAVDYMVEIGGEVLARGVNSKGKPWVIGIDRPEDGNVIPGQYMLATISLKDKGMATSGNYRKFYVDPDGRKVVHTINAMTGESRPGNLLQATIVAENAALADALATLMMAQGLEKSVEQLANSGDFSGYLVYSAEDGSYRTYISPGMEAIVSE